MDQWQEGPIAETAPRPPGSSSTTGQIPAAQISTAPAPAGAQGRTVDDMFRDDSSFEQDAAQVSRSPAAMTSTAPLQAQRRPVEDMFLDDASFEEPAAPAQASRIPAEQTSAPPPQAQEKTHEDMFRSGSSSEQDEAAAPSQNPSGQTSVAAAESKSKSFVNPSGVESSFEQPVAYAPTSQALEAPSANAPPDSGRMSAVSLNSESVEQSLDHLEAVVDHLEAVALGPPPLSNAPPGSGRRAVDDMFKDDSDIEEVDLEPVPLAHPQSRATESSAGISEATSKPPADTTTVVESLGGSSGSPLDGGVDDGSDASLSLPMSPPQQSPRRADATPSARDAIPQGPPLSASSPIIGEHVRDPVHDAHSEGSGESARPQSIPSIHSARNSDKEASSPAQGLENSPGSEPAAADQEHAPSTAMEAASVGTESAQVSAREPATADNESGDRVADQWELKLAARLEEARLKKEQEQAEAAAAVGAAGEPEEDMSQDDGSVSGHESFVASSKSEDAWG